MADVTFTGFEPAPVGVGTLPFAVLPVFLPAAVAVATLPLVPPASATADEALPPTDMPPGVMVVLTRRAEFSPATGDPAKWKPAAGYGFGTARLSRELGLGELLSYSRVKQGAVDALQNVTGVNLFGGVLDWSETVECTCCISLLDAHDEPEIGDELSVEGRTFVLYFLNPLNAIGEERHLIVRMVRWNGLTVRHRREGEFTPPVLT